MVTTLTVDDVMKYEIEIYDNEKGKVSWEWFSTRKECWDRVGQLEKQSNLVLTCSEIHGEIDHEDYDPIEVEEEYKMLDDVLSESGEQAALDRVGSLVDDRGLKDTLEELFYHIKNPKQELELQRVLDNHEWSK